MALGTYFYYSFGPNLLTISVNDNSLNVSLRAFTKSNGSFIPIFQTFLHIPDLFLTFIALSVNENLFKQFMQAYLAI